MLANRKPIYESFGCRPSPDFEDLEGARPTGYTERLPMSAFIQPSDLLIKSSRTTADLSGFSLRPQPEKLYSSNEP